jgi:hypothetical protein
LITKNTVFVLGAGSSQPFAFPLGSELKKRVLENYRNEQGNAVHLYNTTPFTTAQVSQFIEGLGFSGLSSVDAFLERRPTFLDIGKATMGIELLTCEHTSNLWQDGNNWLTYLYNNLVGNNLDEFADNRVAFITFNYDRTVAHFFYTSLLHTFGKSVEETASIIDKIPIIHLHGRLGFLPWQANQNVVPYGTTNLDIRTMEVLLREIKVVHEDITDVRDKEFTRAKELLAGAANVYLIGFGFGTRNVERLGLSNVQAPGFAGTAYGMTNKEAHQCQQLCGGRVNLIQSYPALEFLRNSVALN